MKTPFLVLTSLGLCLVARAESPNSIPNPRTTNRSSIYDGARVLSDAEERSINNAINALERKKGAQTMVVTVQNLDGMSIEEWSNDLFRRIGIGHKGKDDGLLFVFAMQDRKSRLEVGLGLEDVITDARATALLREQVAPAFRRGAYGEGILDGFQVAANYVEGGTRPTARPTPRRTTRSTTKSGSGFSSSGSTSSGSSAGGSTSSGSSSGGYSPPVSYSPSSGSGNSGGAGGGLLLLGVLAVGGVGGLVYMSTRPRRCPQCNEPMTWTEASDADLSDAEQVERSMGSRSFKRCLCSKCGYSDIEKKDALFSGVDRCSRCGNRTARTHTRTLSSATYSSEGREEITEECEYLPCGHVERRTRSIPRKVRSTSSSSSSRSSSSSSSSGSSSSSSYGGGDSGGGGGSSSW